MFTKRFLFLVGVLVALNTALWLTPEGFAVRKAVLPQLFGKNLLRADVIDSTGGTSTAEWRVDRGVITAASLTQLTLKEADTHVQTIGVSLAATKVETAGKSLPLGSLAKGWHVLVTWQNGTADLVKVEKR